ncbi:response regulator transcription factor [Agromyces atrinae]|uniref:response regulator transcription factor n=1 Tax=Agromyces atrinae TaxID=592376 RepID=UPI001F56BAE9|nr:response regulator transcription factor [Agromyces atrinae]MCI2957745.1 response regulator transcription factor [Agromyces atrinae]
MVSERRTAVIIEDDADIRHLLETVLEQAGFSTVATGNGLDGIAAVRAYDPVITTLDVSMPGIDGFETAKRIRTFSQTYIVMLSARSEEIDTLQGLEAGADDYLTKPFRPRELRARIEAMLRRPRAVPTDAGETVPVAAAAPAAPVAPAVPEPVAAPEPVAPAAPAEAAAQPVETQLYTGDGSGPWLEHRGLRLSPEERVLVIDGHEINLTRSEFDLLEALMTSRRRVRSKADLALLLRGESYVTSHFVSEADKRAVEVHLANLRRKIGDNSSQPEFIETVRGIGYRMTAVEES